MSIDTRQRGVSLLELIAAIAVMSIALSAIMSVFIDTTRRSADPMVRQQAQLIAQSYLEEILLKKFVDPDSNDVCPTPEVAGRGAYDNVCDYRNISNAAIEDQFGTPITALSGYKATVTVTRDGTVDLNGLVNGAGTQVRVMRVDVMVTGPGGTSITLSGYRTNYNCNLSTDAGSGCRAL